MTGGTGGMGGTGGTLSGTAGSGGGAGGAILDAATQDRPADAVRPTPRLNWTLMTPSWDAWFVAGEATGETWIATRPGSVLQLRADGTTSQTNLALTASARVTGLWVAGPNNAYASAYANLVLHWDGSGTWKRDIMTSGTLFTSVWGAGPADVYASAGGGPYHSTGDDKWTAWPVTATTMAGLGPLGGSGPTDVWIAGVYGEIFRSTGDGVWHQETTPQTPGVNQIWVANANEAYMVNNVTVMHRRSTGGWVAETPPLTGNDFIHWIWGSAANDVYAVTDQGHLFHSTGDGGWQDEGFDPGGAVALGIRCVWGRNAGDVYLATSNGLYHGVP